MKIYRDDPHVPYKKTEINYNESKHQIDGILAQFGVRDYAWHWDPDNLDVWIEFKFSEVIEDVTVTPIVRVKAPLIYNRKTQRSQEEVNWNTSMRVMFWFIKSHMEAAYLTQSSRTQVFLPYISLGDGQQLGKVLIKVFDQLDRLPQLAALPDATAGNKTHPEPIRLKVPEDFEASAQ